MGAFTAIPVADQVYWVGAIDWNLRNFHGYQTSRGTTYNAYLVLADRVTLIDTVKAPFRDEMLARIDSVVDPRQICTVVSNHAEMDHSGCLPDLIRQFQPAHVYASKDGVKALDEHFGIGARLTAVEDGGTIDLGNRRLTCFATKMLHWPDSMVSYLSDENILFSQDAFGMHVASSERFADELPLGVLRYEAAKYFANILLPYSGLIEKAIPRLRQTGLEFKVIAPDHGPLWRHEPSWIVERYLEWAVQKPSRRAVVVYDTMWHSTDLLARAIGDGLTAGGVPVKLLSLAANHRSDVATEVLGAGALLVGSPTMNNQLYPTVADCLTYLKGLKPKNLLGAAFGSYGWSGEAVSKIEDEFVAMRIESVADGVKVKYVPRAADLDRGRELGLAVAARLKEKCPA